jgi:hypothetical protein
MEYKGKLYGKIRGRYLLLELNTEDFDRLENRVKELKQLCIDAGTEFTKMLIRKCPNCKSPDVVEFIGKNKRSCQICGHSWKPRKVISHE